jgi:hypothetical protein
MSVSSLRSNTILFLYLIVLSVAVLSCQSLERDKEYPSKDEDFSDLPNDINLIQHLLLKEKHHGALLRGFHAKSHGCLKGRLVVLPLAKRTVDAKFEIESRDTLRGIFKEEREYQILARFSNGLGFKQPDSDADVRGLAIKVLGVEGERVPPVPSHPDPEQHTQDFIMTNNPTQLTSTAEEFMQFGEGQHSLGAGHLLKKWRSFMVVLRTMRDIESLVNEQYWSDAPIRLGKRAIKYSAVPCSKGAGTKDRGENYLTEELRNYAATHTICFGFAVQFQLDPVKQPIEDALIEWEEDDTPFIPVAEIHFPPQQLKETQGCEDLRFTPWHALAEHRPLGNMNRGRRGVYDASQRHRYASFTEPNEHSLDTEP